MKCTPQKSRSRPFSTFSPTQPADSKHPPNRAPKSPRTRLLLLWSKGTAPATNVFVDPPSPPPRSQLRRQKSLLPPPAPHRRPPRTLPKLASFRHPGGQTPFFAPFAKNGCLSPGSAAATHPAPSPNWLRFVTQGDRLRFSRLLRKMAVCPQVSPPPPTPRPPQIGFVSSPRGTDSVFRAFCEKWLSVPRFCRP